MQKMNRTRWLFEGWQLRLADEERAKTLEKVGKEAVDAFRQVLCAVLGTNLEPIGEADPDAPDGMKYRWPNADEFTPLVFAIARPDYLKQAFEKIEKVMPDFSPEESAAIEQQVPFTEEDLQFFDDIPIDERKAFWNSEEIQQQMQHYVIQKDPNEVLREESTKTAKEPRKRVFSIEDDDG